MKKFIILSVLVFNLLIPIACHSSEQPIRDDKDEICSCIAPPHWHNIQKPIWNDETEMAKYYKAIKIISLNLDTVVSKNKFDSPVEPNPVWNRTPRYMFVEIMNWSDGGKQLYKLYTPFGQVQLLSGGLLSDILTHSKIYLERMHDQWNISNVTDLVQICNYTHNELSKSNFTYYKRSYSSYSQREFIIKTQLYLIKSVDDIILFDESKGDDENDLIIYLYSILQNQQYNFDKALVTKLSSRNK